MVGKQENLKDCPWEEEQLQAWRMERSRLHIRLSRHEGLALGAQVSITFGFENWRGLNSQNFAISEA